MPNSKPPEWFPLERALTPEQKALAIKMAQVAMSGGGSVQVILVASGDKLRCEVRVKEYSETC